MNAQSTSLVERIIEEVNEEFRYMVQADKTVKGNIQLTLKTRKHYEPYEIEEVLSGVFDYTADKFNVDFSIINFYKNALIVEIIEY